VPAVVCIALAAAFRPWAYGGRTMPGVDRWLAVFVAATAAQLLPLPPALLNLVSPSARAAASQLSLAVPSWLSISIDDPATSATLLVNAALVIVFLVALRIFAARGVRLFARGVAMMGLLLSLIALAQDATAHGLMYWRWKPLDEGSPPFGPFVNRNHFATWVVLALPLTIGYLAAHSGAHRERTAPFVPFRRRIVTFFDGRAALLTAAACLMAVALVATLSRSGLFGLAAAAAAAIVLRIRHGGAGHGRAVWWMAAATAAAIGLIFAAMPPGAIAARLARAPVSAADRLTIWRDTLPIVRDFWLTGTGAGTYETSMLVFQRASPGVRFNQAHNHYLQLASEGGLLLCVPLFAALALYVRQAWARVAADQSGMAWIRAGALSGLAGAAAQSVWETGLATPANAALAAVLCAIVIHEPRRN
jgi:putative inorganic carbon (hco3(-)) transporter